MMNQVCIMGNLTKDPELRRTASGIAVVSFSIAVERDYAKDGERGVDFFDLVAYRSCAEFIARNFHKGQLVAFTGRLLCRKWTDKNGNNRQSVEIVVERGYFASSAPNRGSAKPPVEAAAPAPEYADDDAFKKMNDDAEDCPYDDDSEDYPWEY